MQFCNAQILIALKLHNETEALSFHFGTCSCGGDRNSLVFLAVSAADMFKACMTSLYLNRWLSWSLATKSSEKATMASIRCRTWQSQRYWSKRHIWENNLKDIALIFNVYQVITSVKCSWFPILSKTQHLSTLQAEMCLVLLNEVNKNRPA